MSEKSISLSCRAVKRAFAFFVSAGARLGFRVNLTIPVVFTLMSLCLSCGDDTDNVPAQRIGHGNLEAFDQANGDPPRLPVLLSCVGPFQTVLVEKDAR